MTKMIKKIKKMRQYVKPVIAGLAVLVLVGGVSVLATTGGFWDRVAQYAGQSVANKIDVPSFEEPVISGTSPMIPFDWIQVGELTHRMKRFSLVTATTTPCRIQAPVATSTLVAAGVQFTYGSSTDIQIDIAKTTDALSYASTTAIGTTYVLQGTGGQWSSSSNGTIVASTTPGIAANINTFKPSEWFVVKIGGANLGYATNAALLAPTGSCWAEWREF